ncbi:MAG: nuclear transport factor 2 family protein [Pseudomonadota bacterium]
MTDATDHQVDLVALQARIARLEDIEAIKQLKALYCEICDDSHDPDRIVTIFTEDGIWEGKGIGTATGHSEIRSLFEGFQKMMSFTQHMTMNPRIQVDGDTATGTWYFFGPFTFRENDQAKWQATRYHETYQRVGGEWKIKHLKIAPPGMSVTYEAGWGKSRYN